jgi:drug/metabolite transporter (DMT)-like permease
MAFLNVATIVAAILAQAGLACGQITLKIWAGRISETGFAALQDWNKFLYVLVPGIIVGLIYTAVMAMWLFVLKNMPLNRAFLFVSLSFVFVPLLAYFFLKETISVATIVGTALIIAGIMVGVKW